MASLGLSILGRNSRDQTLWDIELGGRLVEHFIAIGRGVDIGGTGRCDIDHEVGELD